MLTICFYTFESYNELKKVADDKEVLCDTYSDWLVEFNKAVVGLKEQGVEVGAVSVNINVGELGKWCKRKKLRKTSALQAKYVAEIGESLGFARGEGIFASN